MLAGFVVAATTVIVVGMTWRNRKRILQKPNIAMLMLAVANPTRSKEQGGGGWQRLGWELKDWSNL